MADPNSSNEAGSAGATRRGPRFPVVGIGASAGGIAALQRFFEHMPPDTGMAFVVVMHLSPTHESSLASILAKATTMPVTEVVETASIEPDRVFVISPALALTVADGQLRVAPLTRTEGRHTAIDLLFRSLGEAHQERAIGVVLSGTGSDGTQGLKRVKERGGVTLAQSPTDAEYDGMPTSAIATGLVDVVLPAAELPARLVQLWQNARRLELPEQPATSGETTAMVAALAAEEALLSIKAILRERTGNDFSHYKRATVLRRLERRMQVNGVPNLVAYRKILDTRPEETQALLQDMLISVTNFFRDRESFDGLEHELLAQQQQRRPDLPMRAWVAGCATGEEAYSIAIVLSELQEAMKSPIGAQVFASDIDQRAIDAARRGYFPASIVTDVPAPRLRQHFTVEADGYRISKRVRECILFSVHNALRDPPFTRLDLVCCRNLLIYLDRDAQQQLLQIFHFALEPGGLLFLGNSESTDAAEGLFTVVDKKQRIFRPTVLKRNARPVSSVPQMYAAQPLPIKPAAQVRPPLQELHERAAARHGAPTVLIDADHTVLHVSEHAAHLLRIPAGAPSAKLLDLVRPELRIELRTALYRAIETDRSVQARRVQFKLNGVTWHLSISVRPVPEEGRRGMLLVTFDQAESTMEEPADGGGISDRPMLLALEAELLRVRSHLKETLGESAASTEELRASNEELQTINEELRSATEELETSREELQSVNEELTTVNNELMLKVEETGRINDDLQNLVASIQIGTVFVDLQMRVKRFTPNAAKLFNFIGTDVGRSLLDITHRLEYPELEEDLQRTFESLATSEREVRSSEGLWFLVRVQPFRTSEQRIEGAVMNFVDISRRRAAEEAVRLSEQRLRLVAASMHAYAIITLGPDGRITSWSTGATALFGYSEDEALGQPCELIFTAEDAKAGAAREEMRIAAEVGRADDDRWMQKKGGKVFFCSGVMTPMFEGKLVGFAKICRDFTESRLASAARDASLTAEQRARSQVEEASSLKDEFLAVMSHELRNPLNIIQLNVLMLERSRGSRQDPDVERAVSTIATAVNSQLQIIDDLMDMSRLRTRKLALALGRVDFGEVVSQIVEAVAPSAERRRQSLLFVPPPERIFLRADRVRVEQIVWNLVNNAIKFTPETGAIQLALEGKSPLAKLTVTDDGIGLDGASIDSVFEMFRQADSVSVGRGGMGIGLALVKQLAELHGGRVAVESAGLGQGASFSVWLPIDETDVQAGSRAQQHGVLKGYRLLLVDDERDAAEGLATLLRLEGAEVTAVGDADAALEVLARESFDLLLSDISMPVRDGYWLIGNVRARWSDAELPAIAVSGRAREQDRARMLAAGFGASVSKPLDLQLLATEIRRLTPPH